MYYHHWFILRFEKIVAIDNLVDSPTRRVGESFFDYEYLRDSKPKLERLEM